jgi:branched-chain amino acid transport system substrate-binding protein
MSQSTPRSRRPRRRTTPRFRRPERIAAVAAVGLLLTACGTRVSDEQLTAAGSLGGNQVIQPGVQNAATSSEATTPTGTGATTLAPGAGTAPGTTTIPGPTPAAQGATKPGKNAATAVPGAVAATALADAPCTQQLDPISVGQIGAFSGFLEPTLGGYRPGLAVWAAEVNARGGVQCHPIRLSQRDDGSDPARTTSAVKDLVENQKVIAMISADVPITIAAYRAAMTPTGIPTIGGDMITPDWTKDPLLYPNGGGNSIYGFAGSLKAAVQNTGLKKVGLIHCVEASICGLIRDSFSDMAKWAGAEVVSVQSASLTQPDFTSQCQSAKNAGAEMLFTAIDTSSHARLFKSCAAIGFRPPTASTSIAVGPATATDPNAQAATIYLNSPHQPYANATQPMVKAFLDAVKKFAPGARIDQPAVAAYAAGKLFEAALAKVAEQARAGSVTTRMLIEGMHQIKNETLGGLSAVPLTFKAGPHQVGNCYFVTLIDRRGTSDLTKGQPQCL